MATFTDIRPAKTYATETNAKKAVDKFGYPDTLRYIVMRTEDRRFFPVFVGRADELMQHGVHFNFNVIG